jgi:hypothetical protein
MKTYKSAMMLMVTVFVLSACESERVEVLKSPCAGIDGSPCGPKRNVNGTLNTHPLDHS